MESAKKPLNEDERLSSLLALNLLDTLPESDFDHITKIASQITGMPVSLISLVDKERQWFKSKVGLNASETSREVAFCAHAILKSEIFEIEDASKDSRFFDNPLVTGSPHVQFYAGAPLLSPDHYPIGTLCVIDHKPNKLSEAQKDALRALSSQVTRLLELKSVIKQHEIALEKLTFKTVANENIGEGVVLQDSSGAIIEFNPSALELLELTADQLTGKTSFDPDWRAIREDESSFPGEEHPAIVTLKTGKTVKNVVMGIRSKLFKTRWLKISSVPIFKDQSIKPTHAITSFSDITKQHEDTKFIHTQHQQLRFILDSIPHLIGHWDSDLVNLDSNLCYTHFFGKSTEAIRGMKMKDLLGEEIFHKNNEYISAVLNGKQVSFERILTSVDGKSHQMLATYVPHIVNQKVTDFLAIIIDITELKNLENERRDLEVKLTESSRLSTLGEMASGIAHEINNPLAIIRSQSSLLRRKTELNLYEKESFVKGFQTIDSTVDRIAKIIKGLKSYSRNAESDPFIEVSLRSIIEETLSLCQERFYQNNIKLEYSKENDFNIKCRPAQISQILMNLLSNAYDAIATLEEKWIRLSVSVENENIKINVMDSGLGIDPKIVNKMMNPFFTTKDVGKGTGLGLSISQGIAKTHGGGLEYDFNQKHTTFVLTLPKI